MKSVKGPRAKKGEGDSSTSQKKRVKYPDPLGSVFDTFFNYQQMLRFACDILQMVGDEGGITIDTKLTEHNCFIDDKYESILDQEMLKDILVIGEKERLIEPRDIFAFFEQFSSLMGREFLVQTSRTYVYNMVVKDDPDTKLYRISWSS